MQGQPQIREVEGGRKTMKKNLKVSYEVGANAMTLNRNLTSREKKIDEY